MENYIKKRDILVKENVYSKLWKINTFMFDVDGVLVNVDLSYYQTIIETGQYYFSRIINIPIEGILINQKIIKSFKMVGGFNDDWELAAAIILYYLWKIKEYDLKSSVELKERDPSIVYFVNQNLSEGGGLPQLEEWVSKNSSNPNEIFSLFHKEKIFQIGKEFYAGKRHCFCLYGFHPQIVQCIEGNIEKETIIIKPETTAIIKKYNTGVLTGRNQNEAKLIMERIDWNSWIVPETVITQEDYQRKPSPEGIEYLMKYFNSKYGLYIGDTMDDLLTVINFNQLHHEGSYCFSALVLGNRFAKEDGIKEYYMKYGVDIIAENVNQVIRFVYWLPKSFGKLL